MIGDPSNSMPGSVVTMAGAPEAPPPRAIPRAFDDPAQQRRRLALFNEIKDYARGQNYPGVSDGEISQMAAAASHKLDAMGGADRVNFAAQGDAAVATLVQSTFANFLSSKTEREIEAMRQPPTSAATAGADQGRHDKGGIDPLTGLMGVERQALGGMRTAGTAGTNADSGSSRGGSGGYDAINGGQYNATKGFSSLTPQNFGGSEFAKAGLDYSTTMRLAQQGFSPTAIKQAANLTNELGINTKEHVEDVAKLKRDVPGVERGLRKTKASAEEVARLEKKAEEARTQEERQRLMKRAEEKRKELEEHNRRERERAEKAKPGSGERLGRVQQATEDAAQRRIKGANLSPAEKAKLEAATKRAHENPNDPAAQKALKDLQKQKRFSQAAKGLQKDAATQNKIAQQAEQKAERNDATSATETNQARKIVARATAKKGAAMAALD